MPLSIGTFTNSVGPRCSAATFALSFSLATTVRTDACVGQAHEVDRRRRAEVRVGVPRVGGVGRDVVRVRTARSDAGVTCSALPLPSSRVRHR